MMKNKISIAIFICFFCTGCAFAQLSPSKSQYYINPYLVNPAMAGYHQNTEVFVNYANQWNKIEGAPELLSFSANTTITERAAVGINYFNDKAGLISKSQALASYAYKVPINDENSVRFGVSLSWSQDRLDQSKASSSGAIDPSLNNYNERQSYWDGNMGVSFVGKKLEAQFSYLNLNQKRQNQFSTVDYSTFYSSVSYKFTLNEAAQLTLKPLIAYRGVKDFDNQWDVAAEWGFRELNMYSMYHSTKAFTGGLGYLYEGKLSISAMYSSEPVTLRGLSGGIFEIGLGYKL